MGYPQPLSAQTASTYPAVQRSANTATPAAPPEEEPADHRTGLSVGDAAWVVMRSLATAAECLNFVCRKVVVLAGICFGGFIGLLQYAHENLGDRTVQPVPADDNHRVAPQQATGQEPNGRVQEGAERQNPPVEEYVRQGANRWKHFVESSATPGSEYSWMYLVSMVLSVTLSIYLLGIVGAIILHSPNWLFQAEPYFYLDKPPAPQSLPRSASALPSHHQDPQTSSHPPLPPAKSPPTATAGQLTVPSVATGNNDQSPQQPPRQYGTDTRHELPATVTQFTQQPATSTPSCPQANRPSPVQPLVQPSGQRRLYSYTTGNHMPTSVPVHQM